MAHDTPRLSALGMLAAFMLFSACAEPVDPEPPPPPIYPTDLTIPPVPVPSGPQPVVQRESVRGATVDSGLMGFNPQAIVGGRIDRQGICLNSDTGCFAYVRDLEHGDSVAMNKTSWHDDCTPRSEPYIVPGWTNFFQHCATLTRIDATVSPPYLKHRRFWKNVTSRLLGPGTTYSISYTWTSGVSTSNGWQYSATVDQTNSSVSNTRNCVGGKVGFDIFGAAAEVTTDNCWENTTTSAVSRSISQTLNTNTTLSSESSVTETTAVSGVDGGDRVYTVWQLFDEYVYADASGNEITSDYIKSSQAFMNAQLVTDVRQNDWQFKGLIWQPTLQRGTEIFAQVTADFPRRSGAAATSAERVTQPRASVLIFRAPVAR